MRRWLVLAALALPVVGAVAGIARHELALVDASRWQIPVSGADPRDVLRGHYVTFRYDWRFAGPAADCANGCRLCVEGAPPRIDSVRVARAGESCRFVIDTSKSAITVFAPQPGTRNFSGRIFVAEQRAPGLAEELRQRPMRLTARLTRDGRLVNEQLEPRP
jgi:hypothetical protein